tara:strand:- start:2397 stop:3341 length:945 start_codon:yes stop_codon:yes gene_type:complete
MYATFLLIIGLLFLYYGGDLLVRGSVGLALRFKISTLVVGMTVMSFSTSCPELFVTVKALFSESSNIALGNVIGSNIANIALVLAVTALIFKLKISQQTIRIDFPFMIIVTVLFGLILYYFKQINYIIGIFFIVSISFFSYFLISKSKNDDRVISHNINNEYNNTLRHNIVLLILGILLLKFGADYLVDGAILIANKFDISDRVIAVSVIAIGTSLPELVASVIAAYRKENSLAIGNIIGSNIFNILIVLGVSSLIKTIKIEDYAILNVDYLWMMLIFILIGIFIYRSKNQQISRFQGGILLLCYIYYIYSSVV